MFDDSDGLIHGKYPSAYPQIISTFSMHYIYMLQEYYHQTNDLKTVRKYFPDMDQILAYYDSKIGTDGLVGRLGDIGNLLIGSRRGVKLREHRRRFNMDRLRSSI